MGPCGSEDEEGLPHDYDVEEMQEQEVSIVSAVLNGWDDGSNSEVHFRVLNMKLINMCSFVFQV